MGDQVVNYCEQLGFPLLHISGCFYFANLSPLFSSGPTTSCPIPLSFWTFSTFVTFPFWAQDSLCTYRKNNSQGVFNRRAGQKKDNVLEFSLRALLLKTFKNVSSFVCTWPRLDAVNMLIEWRSLHDCSRCGFGWINFILEVWSWWKQQIAVNGHHSDHLGGFKWFKGMVFFNFFPCHFAKEILSVGTWTSSSESSLLPCHHCCW